MDNPSPEKMGALGFVANSPGGLRPVQRRKGARVAQAEHQTLNPIVLATKGGPGTFWGGVGRRVAAASGQTNVAEKSSRRGVFG